MMILMIQVNKMINNKIIMSNKMSKMIIKVIIKMNKKKIINQEIHKN